jgi:DNA-binding GntR family transcriptional regulator
MSTRASATSGPSPMGSVTADIRQAILQGDFVPGQRLVEIDLSDQFSASRGAVRSALLELATEGLVERMANRGARVRIVPFDEAIEIYEVRMVVEALCAAKAAERIDPVNARLLRTIGKDMSAAVSEGDIARYRDLNQQLHGRIRDMSGQQTAVAVLERMRAQSVRQQFKVASLPGRPKVSLPEHLAMIAAICAGDPAAAEDATREHLRSVMAAMQAASEDERPVQ